jgi:hypothetical protein
MTIVTLSLTLALVTNSAPSTGRHIVSLTSQWLLVTSWSDNGQFSYKTKQSLDITNLYTNIPIRETRDILFDKLEQNNIEPKTKQELMKWFDTITSQNYFTHNGNIQVQNDGLAMGAPSSGLIRHCSTLYQLSNTFIINVCFNVLYTLIVPFTLRLLL